MAKRRQVVHGDPGLAVGYLRLSPGDRKSGQGADAAGVEAQRSDIRRWAAANGVEIVAWFEDIDTCGQAESLDTPLADRPGMMAAISAVRELGAGLLVVQKRDRLARDVMLAAMATRLVEREGAKIVSANGAGNGESPEAALMRGIIDLFAEYELAMIRARTRAALAAKQTRGEHVGSVPYGFILDKQSGRLVPCEEELRVVERVRLLRSRMTLAQIASTLNAEGVRTRRKTIWSPETVRALLLRATA